MARACESSGSIETFCQRAEGPASRRSAYSFDEISVGDSVGIVFSVGDDARPPYSLKIRGPNGALVVERILREIPTGLPQSEPPIVFVASAPGKYLLEIRELSGKSSGQATITVGGLG